MDGRDRQGPTTERRTRTSPTKTASRMPDVSSGGHTRERSSPEAQRSPRLSRRVSKGKGPDRPPYLREIGSATISLRPTAVEKLSDEDSASSVLPVHFRAASDDPRKLPSRRVDDGGRTRAGSGGRGSTAPVVSPLLLATAKRTPPIITTSIPSPSPNRRPRSSSIHYASRPPVGPGRTGESYFLPHYSLDREYSLKPDGSPNGQVSLELGLGGDFDASFGEAMRNGTAGKEMQLPPQALRALSEAKVNLDERVSSKQGRKGSITMGLFKETRAQSRSRSTDKISTVQTVDARAGAGLFSPTGAVEEVISEEEDDHTRSRVPSVEERLVEKRSREPTGGSTGRSDMSRSHSRTSIRDRPGPSISRRLSGDKSRIAPPLNREETFRASSASTSTGRSTSAVDTMEELDYEDETPRIDPRASYISRLQDEDSYDRRDSDQSAHSMSFGSESGWSTTSEESSVSSLGSAARRRMRSRSQSEVHESQMDSMSATDVEGEEEEPMTVPLQPFGHAVGGHSSIYQFTRRAVCKVSLAQAQFEGDCKGDGYAGAASLDVEAHVGAQ